MWERYGFYVIQTVLVFYILHKLHLNDSISYTIAGSFTALAYINSFFGGIIADKFIGSNIAILIGGILLFIGYMILGLIQNPIGLTISLGLISSGTGMVKPNISSLLSTLYTPDDKRKDAGYVLYYVGIYVGALGGGLLGGYISSYMGWRATFISAAVGIALGIAIYLHGKIKFNITDKRKTYLQFIDYTYASISIIVMLVISCVVLHSEFLAILYFIVMAILCLGFILFAIITHHGVERKKLIAFSLLIIMAVFYWAIFYQQFFSISLCIERVCKLPYNIPASSVPAVESLCVILFGPLINYVWLYFSNRGKEISIPAKFSSSFLLNSFCFILISAGLWYSMSQGEPMNPVYILLAYAFVAIGELCISPTSLSMVSELVPKRYSSAMMGISLLSIGFGGKLAGLLAYQSHIVDVEHTTIPAMQLIYLHSFISYFIISITTFIVSIILGIYIKKLLLVR
jgi:POT family proton-dependent oligopeptide transporter